MTWKESIISIQAQIQAATGRELKTSSLMRLVRKSDDGESWEAEYRGVIYTRPADTERREKQRRCTDSNTGSNHGDSKQ